MATNAPPGLFPFRRLPGAPAPGYGRTPLRGEKQDRAAYRTSPRAARYPSTSRSNGTWLLVNR